MKYFENIALAILAVFAPIKAVLLTVFVLVMGDLITGIMASHKKGKPITSSGLKRTVGKLLVYELAIALAFLAHTFLTGDTLPVDKLLASIVGLTELKSVLENIEIINGSPVFSVVINKITSAQKHKKP